MPGTDIAYVPMLMLSDVRNWPRVWSYAMSGTDLAYRAPSAVPTYGVVRYQQVAFEEMREWLQGLQRFIPR
eukprot:86832-Rhodomonas_salina.3